MDHHNLAFGFALPGAHAHPPIPPTANMLAVHPTTHPGPTSSPPQSVPGRRTPLGSVGIGGFYAQGLGMLTQSTPGDENKPETAIGLEKSSTMASLMAPSHNLLCSSTDTNTGVGNSAGASATASATVGITLPNMSSLGASGKQKNRQGKSVRLNINAR